MITKEQFERFRKFYSYLQPIVIQAMKEKYEVEHIKPFNKSETVSYVEYEIEDNVFIVKTFCYSGCGGSDDEHYYIDPKFIYDENAMEKYKEEIALKRQQAALKEIEEMAKKQELTVQKEHGLLVELAKKYGYRLTNIEDERQANLKKLDMMSKT